MHVSIEKLEAHAIDQFIELIRVFDVVFDMDGFKMPPSAYLQRVLAQDTFWVFVAVVDDKVVGGLTAYVLPQYYTQRPLVYLYDLAVSHDYQRRGIGSQLVAGLNNYCRSLGIDEVFVQADGDDVEAINFYRATGGLAEQVVHFTYPLTE